MTMCVFEIKPFVSVVSDIFLKVLLLASLV